MAEGFIVRKAGGGATTEAPTINVTEETSILKFTLTNNDDNTAFITYKIDTLFDTVELTSGATSSEITIDTLADGTYTLEAYATVVGEVVTSDTVGITLTLNTYELIADVEVTSNTTQIDFDNLNITKDDELRLVYTLVQDNTSVASFRLYVNNDTNTSNYANQRLFGNGSSLTAERVSNNLFATSFYNQETSGYADIKISNNDRFVVSSYHVMKIGSASSSIENRSINMMKTTGNVSSITKLSVNTDRNMIQGTRLTLYKVNTGSA